MSIKTPEKLGTTRSLLIIIGVLCTLALNSELRAVLTASASNCAGGAVLDDTIINLPPNAVPAKVRNQRLGAMVESMVTPQPEEEEAAETAEEDETAGRPNEQQLQQQPALAEAAAASRERRKLNFKPVLSGEPRSWENMPSTKPLNFLHIPKTGGSSIFRLAANNGLAWGECLFPSPWRQKDCPKETNVGKWPEHRFGAPWWHTPIQYLPPDKKPYNRQDLFAVVRNPYERAVSEYYYYCQFRKSECYGIDKHKDTADRMNRKLQQFLFAALRAPKNSTDYFVASGHWIPQYDFFHNTASKRKERIVKHLLHNEHLNDEFASLMRAYGYNFTLPQKHRRSRKDTGAKLTTADLTDKTMKLIDIVFEKDFKIGNYEMLTGKVAEA